MAKKEYFDLECFLTSTDAGLYREGDLFPSDLVKIGKVTKTFSEFTKYEKNYLWNKFEKMSMKIPKKYTGLIIGKRGSELDFIQSVFNVSLKINSDKKGPFTFVSGLS